jgi:hypothetical protein
VFSRSQLVETIICKRCGKAIPPWNNAEIFDRILSSIRTPIRHNYSSHLLPTSNHLLPVTDESGKLLCIGSPSRCQYFEGYPKDTRGKAEYLPESEKDFREARQELRRVFPPPEQEASKPIPELPKQRRQLWLWMQREHLQYLLLVPLSQGLFFLNAAIMRPTSTSTLIYAFLALMVPVACYVWALRSSVRTRGELILFGVLGIVTCALLALGFFIELHRMDPYQLQHGPVDSVIPEHGRQR